jgi:thiaminase/transcriptional activator TenA
MHEQLLAIAEPVLDKVRDHPFWSGLRDGSLPPESLGRFVIQDTGFLLPTYARSLARCAAAASDDGHAYLLAQSVVGTLEARDRLRSAYQQLARQHGWPLVPVTPEIDSGTHAHTSFFLAASARSVAAGVAALLPMVLFNHGVADDLLTRQAPGGRYAPWITVYHPGETFDVVRKAFLGLVDQIAERSSADERAEIVEQFTLSIRYEWAFAENALRAPSWPV